MLDVWQADNEGAYESQLPDVDEARLRAKYTTREDGSYCVRTIAPLGYTIPMDGPVGDLIAQTEISHFRPAHVHFLINVPGYEPLITHLFQEGAEYLDSDVVFGTKQELVVRFEEREPGATPDGGTSTSRGSRRATTSCCSPRTEARGSGGRGRRRVGQQPPAARLTLVQTARARLSIVLRAPWTSTSEVIRPTTIAVSPTTSTRSTGWSIRR